MKNFGLLILLFCGIVTTSYSQEYDTLKLITDSRVKFENCNPDICAIYDSSKNHFQINTYIIVKNNVDVKLTINGKVYMESNHSINMKRYAFYITEKFKYAQLKIGENVYNIKIVIRNDTERLVKR